MGNCERHFGASVVRADLGIEDAAIRLTIRDDGVGGADPAKGTGLIGLRDRVEALGSRVELERPAGGGTRLFAEIPAREGR